MLQTHQWNLAELESCTAREAAFYLIFDLLGIQIETESKTATGRIDAVVRARGVTYVMEFKYGRSAGEALAQINSKG